MSISGITTVQNAVKFDYCVRETVASMLPVCDEVLIGVGVSDDGTDDLIHDIAAREPKVLVIDYPELNPNPTKDIDWLARWLNYVRGFARSEMVLVLDCDEILGPQAYEAVREAATLRQPRYFNYVNFWSSARETTPWGDGRQIRLQPVEYYIRSHGPVPELEMDVRLITDPQLPDIDSIYHYSMLRQPEALYAKCRFLGNALEGWEPDKLLVRAEAEGVPPTTYFTDKQIFTFFHQHPPVIQDWLRARGWLP